MQSDDIVCIDENNPYFSMIRGTWGARLREVFEGIEDPEWGPGQSPFPIRVFGGGYEPLRKIGNPGEKPI